MRKTITATFDGESLRPASPVELEPGRPYRVTIEELPPEPRSGDAWSELDALVGTIDAPEDWAEQHDHYLYGSPRKRTDVPPHRPA